MSLLGIVRHMTEVERGWFRRGIARVEAAKLYCTAADPEGDWDGAVEDEAVVAEAWRNWQAEIRSAEQVMSGVEDLSSPTATAVPVRDVLVHMVEEYARHCGHADLLRECIDGRVGQ